MENSFKPQYDKETLNDITTLKFRSRTVGTHRALGHVFLLMFVMFPVSCAVTSPILMLSKPITSGTVAFWALVAFVGMIVVAYNHNNKTSSLQIQNRVGIKFENKQIPYSDIKFIGTLKETSNNDPVGSSYVYVTTGGQKVKVTNYLSNELAESIADEIREGSA